MPESATLDAESLVDDVYRPHDWDKPLMEAVMPPIAKAMATGAVSEWALTTLAADQQKSAATDAISKYDMQELLDAMPLAIGTEMPKWLKDKITEQLIATFKEPYWQKFNETTRNDVRDVLKTGITEGLSITKLAKAISEKMGPDYQKWRATNTARTESTSACNAGHEMSIGKLQDELQMPVGKEWMSVLGPTTRDTHARMDGAQVPDANGLFNLAGFKVPYPGHPSLPAGERCNCQCTILSCIVQAATKPVVSGQQEVPAESPAAQPEPITEAPPPGLSPQELASLERGPISKLLSDHPDLNVFMDQVAAYQSEALTKLRDMQRELQELESVWVNRQWDRIYALRQDVDEHQDRVRREFVGKFGFAKEDRKEFRGQDADRVINGKILKGAEKDKMAEAREFLSALTAKKAGGTHLESSWLRYHYAVDRKETRAYHSNSRCTMTSDSSQLIYVHESGHAIDHAMGENLRSKEFRDYRCKATPNIDLKKEFKHYDANEIGNEDQFLKAFGGDKERAAYCGKWYEKSSEVMSMGCELLYRDPFAFARDDPEYFKYVMGVLRGHVKKKEHG